MSMSYLERYLGGDYEQVWSDLVALGAGVRQEPVYSEAQAVARETMVRARRNVVMLVDRLTGLGYRFAFPERVWLPPDQASLQELQQIEETYGPLPLSLRAWYEVVGGVNFAGSYPNLSQYNGLDLKGLSYPNCYSDPLVVYPPDGRNVYPYDPEEEWEIEIEPTSEPVYFIDLSPDSTHKANHSGGGPNCMLLPNAGADAQLISEDWHGVHFVSYLRECFRWGGFPGLRYDVGATRSDDSASPSHDPAESTRLVELLSEGLLPL
jgi:hypothetical protein